MPGRRGGRTRRAVKAAEREIACEACGWVAVTDKHRGKALLAEHRKVCPNAADGASRPLPAAATPLRARDQRLAGEQPLEAAHAPVVLAVLGEQRRHAAHARGLGLRADLLQLRAALGRVGGRDRAVRVEPGALGRAGDLARRWRCPRPRRRTPRRARA